MTISIETNITESVKELTYAKNHHYLKLRDQRGKETKLLEHGVLRYSCKACTNVWFQASNNCVCCPCCKSTEVDSTWMRPQLALIPEDETSFEMPNKE